MKRLKFNLALVAMVLGISAAFAFKAPKQPLKHFTQQLYGRSTDGIWHAVGSKTEGSDPGQYTCSESEKPCTALFNSQPAQNATPAPGDIVEDDGSYSVN